MELKFMKSVDDLFALFTLRGDETYGEDVTQRQHALQTAHRARLSGDDDTLIVACLLHDVGQLLGGAGSAAEQGRDARHETSGAAFLADTFPDAILAPIALHVAAKRYLCCVEPAYREGLSDASLLSLSLQGGPFTSDEAATFLLQPFASEAVRLRQHDDGAKEVGLAVPGLSSYRDLIEAAMLRSR
jgi:phosphonate degradation associated HDIG domain protein